MGLRLILQAGTLLLVARLLGPAKFGAFAGVAAFAVLLGTFSTFGTHLVLLSEASRQYRRRLLVLPYCVPTTLIAGSLLLFGYVLFVRILLAQILFPIQLIAAIGVTEIVLQPMLGLPAVQLQAQHKVARAQFLYIVPLLLRFVVVVVAWSTEVDDVLTFYVYGSLASSSLALLAAGFSARQVWPAFRHWRFARVAELRHSTGFAALNATAVGPSELDKALAVRLLPVGGAGIYSAAARVIGALTLPVVAMVYAVLPNLFRAAKERAGIPLKMVTMLYGCAFGYGVAVFCTLWILAPYIATLFGEEYADLGNVTRWLCLAVPGITLRMAVGSLLMALGRPWVRATFEFVGMVALALLAITLTPEHGIVGMVIAIVGAEWSMAFVAGYLAYREVTPVRTQPG